MYADNVFAYFFNPARIRLKKFANKKLNGADIFQGQCDSFLFILHGKSGEYYITFRIVSYVLYYTRASECISQLILSIEIVDNRKMYIVFR